MSESHNTERQYLIQWYNNIEVIATDIVKASSEEEAKTKGFIKYNGKPPSTFCIVTPV